MHNEKEIVLNVSLEVEEELQTDLTSDEHVTVTTEDKVNITYQAPITDKIDENSTNYEAPSAKAVYEFSANTTAEKVYFDDGETLAEKYVNGELGSGGGSVDDEITLTSVSSSKVVAAKNDLVNLTYTFTRETYTTRKGTEKVLVDGVVKSSRSISQGENSVDVTKYLTGNTHTIEIQVTSSGLSSSLVYDIEIIDLSISSNFDGFSVYPGNITYRYTPVGNVAKTIHFILDGSEKTTVVNETGKAMTYDFKDLSHGTHSLEVYATAQVGDSTLTSNKLKYSLVVNNGGLTTVIGCPFDIVSCNQGDLLTFNYIVCDPNSLNAPVILSINGEVVSELTVDRTKQTWSTRNYPSGNTVFKISSNGTEVEFVIDVEANEIVIEPITNNLELHLTANGRSNNESADVRNVWSNNDVVSVLSNFNWKSNGWVIDNNGDTALRVNGGANVYIPLNLFAKDFRGNGKTIEFEFATRDILDYDSILISCENGGRGFKLSSSLAVFSSEQTTIKTKFKEDEKIRLSFVIEPTSENCLVYTYVNGIISGLEQYPADDDFTQVTPVGISIGSVDATIDIYNIRVYGINLDHKDILTNYIADTQDNGVKIDLYNRNDVFDGYGNINYQKVLQQIPCLTIIGELPGSKGDKKTVTIEYKNNADNTKSFKQANAVLDIQGTSSQYFPRKNYKFKLRATYQLTNESIPENVFCIKADYMESSHAHNTGLAKIVNGLYPETPASAENAQVQAAITGFPIVVWHKATESSQADCLGVYNFNNDKDDVTTFGYTEMFPKCESWEFKNNTSAHCLFQNDNFVDTVEVAKNFEARYPDKYTDYTALSRVVSWVASTKDDLDKFKNEFEQYFNKEATMLYYCLTDLFAMVDSRAKNLFLTTWNGTIWYPTFYDMDTAFGLNNEGVNDFSYNVEYHDTQGTQNVFNGESSVLWNNFEQAFADDITEFYNELRNNDLVTYDSVMKVLYDEQISKICESLYNYDAIEKYRDPLLETGENKLFVAQGNRLDHLKWWLSNRFNYKDSEYVASEFKENYMTLRIYTPTTYGSIVPNADVTITPYADQYVKVKYDENMLGDRGVHDEAVTIDAPEQIFNDTPLIIYGASRISDIGDLSPLYPGTVDVSKGIKLKKLIVGNSAEDYSNTNLKELTVGNNELLKVLDVRNCPSLTQAIDVSGCKGIEEIYATGTSTTAVKLPNGGSVKKLHLPNSITNLTILNQLFIEEFVYDSLSKVSTLHIENSNVDEFDIVQQAKGSLSRVRLINIDWTLNSKELLDYLMTCNGIGDTGLNTDKSVLTGKVHIKGSIAQEDLDAYNSYWGAANLVVTADKITVKHICNFYNYDGTLLHTTSVNEGEYATYVGETPTKPNDDTYAYTFASWSPNPTTTPINEPTDFTAQFVASKLLEVKWLNGNGSVVQTDKVGSGSEVTYRGATPTKANDQQYKDYVFTGWLGSDGNTYGNTITVNSALTLTPQFTGTIQTYNVYWYSEGTLLETDVVPYGGTAEYNGATPVHSEGYMFSGWGTDNFVVMGDTSFYAEFKTPTMFYITLESVNDIPSFNVKGINNYDMTVNWGDGTSDTYSLTSGTTTTCTKSTAYSNTGDYIITLPASKDFEFVTQPGGTGIFSCNTSNYSDPKIKVKKAFIKETNIDNAKFMFSRHTTLNELTIPKDTLEIPSCFCYKCQDLTNFIIPNGVTKLGEQAFNYCTSLKSIEIPNSVINTGTNVFASCSSLTSVTISNNITTLQGSVFSSCTSLTNITIPASVTSIGVSALVLGSSSNKATITFESEIPPTIQSSSMNKNYLEAIKVPDASYLNYKSATGWVEYADIITTKSGTYLDEISSQIIILEQSNTLSVSIPYYAVTTPTITAGSSNTDVCTITTPTGDGENINFIVNGLAEGESTITVTMICNGITFTSTFNVYIFISRPSASYEVTTVEGVTYGFELNNNDYYESTNKGVSSSYALAKINIDAPSYRLYLDCINSGESGCDFGILSNLDTTLTSSKNVDSSNVFKSFKSSSSTNVQTVDYGVIPLGQHYIYVKYRKDGSSDSGNDSLQFQVRLE